MITIETSLSQASKALSLLESFNFRLFDVQFEIEHSTLSRVLLTEDQLEDDDFCSDLFSSLESFLIEGGITEFELLTA